TDDFKDRRQIERQRCNQAWWSFGVLLGSLLAIWWILWPFVLLLLISLEWSTRYRIFKSIEERRRTDSSPDRRQIERQRRNQAWSFDVFLGLLLLGILLALWWLIPRNVREFAWWESIQWRLVLSAALALVALLVVFLCSASVVFTIRQMKDCSAR